jgi:hypothetical protein
VPALVVVYEARNMREAKQVGEGLDVVGKKRDVGDHVALTCLELGLPAPYGPWVAVTKALSLYCWGADSHLRSPVEKAELLRRLTRLRDRLYNLFLLRDYADRPKVGRYAVMAAYLFACKESAGEARRFFSAMLAGDQDDKHATALRGMLTSMGALPAGGNRRVPKFVRQGPAVYLGTSLTAWRRCQDDGLVLRTPPQRFDYGQIPELIRG